MTKPLKDDGMKEVKISVVIPVKNREALIMRAIRSVLGQIVDGVEVVVVDDGSEDNTYGILMSIKDKTVRVLRRESGGGASVARNDGVRAAKADWVAFLDSDDIWLPGLLKAYLSVVENAAPNTFFYCGAICMEKGRMRLRPWNIPPTPFNYFLRKATGISTSQIMVNRDFFLKAGGFSQRLIQAEDLDLELRLAKLGCRFVKAFPFGVLILLSSDSMRMQRSIYHGYLDVLNKWNEEIIKDRRARIKWLTRLAWAKLRILRRGDALRSFLMLLKEAPLKRRAWKGLFASLGMLPFRSKPSLQQDEERIKHRPKLSSCIASVTGFSAEEMLRWFSYCEDGDLESE